MFHLKGVETSETSQLTRLRQKSNTCEFGDANALEEQIRDQVINKCLSHERFVKNYLRTVKPCLCNDWEKLPVLWKNLRNKPVRPNEQVMRVRRLIMWVERWITMKIRAQGMLNVFVVEMWGAKLTITDVQLEGSSAENVMGLDILRLCVNQRGRKIVTEAEELE